MNLWLVWFLLVSFPLLLGLYLIWQKSGFLRVFGCFILVILAYYQIHWISPWYISQVGERVQQFKLNDIPFKYRQILSLRWMEASNRLLILPSEEVVFDPKLAYSYYPHLLAVDLDLRQTYWQPIASVNLDATTKVESLDTGYRERRDGLNLYYASASKKGPRVEYSAVGFSLPILNYKIPFYSEISGWQWEKTNFYWKREVVRESDSGPVLVELNQIVFNDNEQRFYGGASAWVMEGKFLIFEPAISPPGHRIFALGPFNTLQNNQSTSNKKK